MTNGSSDRLDRIEILLERSIVKSDERMTRVEESVKVSDERMTRMEQNLTRFETLAETNHQESNERLSRIEQMVASNNRFLESFSADVRRYVDTMNNFTTRIDGVIATNNQDRQEANSRLAAIQRQVSAIARHLGVGNQ